MHGCVLTLQCVFRSYFLLDRHLVIFVRKIVLRLSGNVTGGIKNNVSSAYQGQYSHVENETFVVSLLAGLQSVAMVEALVLVGYVFVSMSGAVEIHSLAVCMVASVDESK